MKILEFIRMASDGRQIEEDKKHQSLLDFCRMLANTFKETSNQSDPQAAHPLGIKEQRSQAKNIV